MSITLPVIGKVYDADEVAKQFGVSVRTVQNWVLRGARGRKLTRLPVGGRFFYRPSDIQEFLTAPPVSNDAPLAKIDSKAAKENLRRQGFKI